MRTPESSGLKIYCQIRPMIAWAGTPRKKKSERAKFLPHIAPFKATARGIAKSVTINVTENE